MYLDPPMYCSAWLHGLYKMVFEMFSYVDAWTLWEGQAELSKHRVRPQHLVWILVLVFP